MIKKNLTVRFFVPVAFQLADRWLKIPENPGGIDLIDDKLRDQCDGYCSLFTY
jgi:hypothetical protein